MPEGASAHRVGEHIGDRVEWMKIGEFAERTIQEARS
jgi:hypothetical protein